MSAITFGLIQVKMFSSKFTFPRFILATVLFISWGNVYAHHLQVTHATVRALPPGITNTAVYLTINNNSDSPVKLVSASSNIAEKVELHEHSYNDGMMTMRQMDVIEIAAGESISLQPGGYHLMMFGLKQSLKPKQQIDIQLQFSDGSDFTLKALAVKPGEEASTHSHH